MTTKPLWAQTPSSVELTGSWRTFRPIIELAKCTRCELCWKFCPDVAIVLDGDGWPAIDYEHCKGCGICEAECNLRAIRMEPE